MGSSVLPAQWLPVHVTNRPDSQGTICFSYLSSSAGGTAERSFQASPAAQQCVSLCSSTASTSRECGAARAAPLSTPKHPWIPLLTAQQDTEGCSLQQGSCLLHFHPPPAPLLSHWLSVTAHSATSYLPLKKIIPSACCKPKAPHPVIIAFTINVSEDPNACQCRVRKENKTNPGAY